MVQDELHKDNTAIMLIYWAASARSNLAAENIKIIYILISNAQKWTHKLIHNRKQAKRKNIGHTLKIFLFMMT